MTEIWGGIIEDCKYPGSVVALNPEAVILGGWTALFSLGLKDLDIPLENSLLKMQQLFLNTDSKVVKSVHKGSIYDSRDYAVYSDEIINDRIEHNDSFSKYLKYAKKQIINEIKANGGRLDKLAISTGEIGGVNEKMEKKNLPYFPLSDSIVLTLAIHGFQGLKISIENYQCSGKEFSGTIVYHFYDHFGLDEDDEQILPGFANWYILQHHTRFKGKYRPFITHVDVKNSFTGKL